MLYIFSFNLKIVKLSSGIEVCKGFNLIFVWVESIVTLRGCKIKFCSCSFSCFGSSGFGPSSKFVSSRLT